MTSPSPALADAATDDVVLILRGGDVEMSRTRPDDLFELHFTIWREGHTSAVTDAAGAQLWELPPCHLKPGDRLTVAVHPTT